MNLKKVVILNTIIIFVMCFIVHFVYDIIPSSLTAIFFPVNESIWEHMKLLYTSVLLGGIIEYIILEKKKIKYNNFFISLFLSATLIIPIYLLMFLPIYYKMGENMFITITIMLIAIIFSQIISYYILKYKRCDLFNKIAIVLIIVGYVIFGYLTYNPIKCELFFDTEEEKYGINNYNV